MHNKDLKRRMWKWWQCEEKSRFDEDVWDYVCLWVEIEYVSRGPFYFYFFELFNFIVLNSWILLCFVDF